MTCVSLISKTALVLELAEGEKAMLQHQESIGGDGGVLADQRHGHTSETSSRAGVAGLGSSAMGSAPQSLL
jgi:hypothetical protein